MGQMTSLRFGPEVVAGMRVLVASSNKRAMTPIVSGLRSDGHSVLWVHGATELLFALEVVADGAGLPPDVVLVDGGVELGSWSAVLSNYAHWLRPIPVLLLVGKPEDEAEFPKEVFPTVLSLRHPVQSDDLRTLVLNLEVVKRSVRANGSSSRRRNGWGDRARAYASVSSSGSRPFPHGGRHED